MPQPVSFLGDDHTAKPKAWTLLGAKPFRSEVKAKIDQFKRDHATQDGMNEVKIKNRRECAVNELVEGAGITVGEGSLGIHAELSELDLRRHRDDFMRTDLRSGLAQTIEGYRQHQ